MFLNTLYFPMTLSSECHWTLAFSTNTNVIIYTGITPCIQNCFHRSNLKMRKGWEIGSRIYKYMGKFRLA